MIHVLVSTFHVVDELDSVGPRCKDSSGTFLTRDGEETATCTRRYDHTECGSPLHRATRRVGDGLQFHDVYWTRE